MRTLVTMIAAFAMVALMGAGTAFAGGSGAGITNSPHDFTDNVYATKGGLTGNIENDASNAAAFNNKRVEICRVCHVPHDHGRVGAGLSAQNVGILWNHDLAATTTWTMYGSVAGQVQFLDSTIPASPQLVSKLCLGCHDGSTAVNQYDGKGPADGGYGGGTTYNMTDFEGGFKVGGTGSGMSNNHPISITYDAALVTADGELNDPAVATFANGKTVDTYMVGGDQLECSTCHDVHDSSSEAVSGTHLLRTATKGADQTGVGASALCLVCHNK